MIKKQTIATFNDGAYAGEYDWTGGIPLSVDELMQVTTVENKEVTYKLVDKSISLKDGGEDQMVTVHYYFDAQS